MTKALVLGGGGVAGIAWETGLLFGLAEAGIDLNDADRVIGTSAGSAVGAQITTGVPLADLYERQLAPPPAVATSPKFDTEKMIAELGAILMGTSIGVERTKAIGAYALAADTGPEAKRREEIAARLPIQTWPKAQLEITAIDAHTGELRVFTPADRDTVELVDAVAASCAVPGIWPPVTIGGRRYIDGGMRSTSNADLAAGYDDVLVVTPMPELPMVGAAVKKAIARLEQQACVVTVVADADSGAAMGSNPLDPATAKPAAEAGRAQAAAHLAEVEALWKGDAGG